MEEPLTLAIISSSHRPESLSRRLGLRVADILGDLGAQIFHHDLRSLPPSFCNGDESGDLAGYPAAYESLYKDLAGADGFIIATPVYLYGVSASTRSWIEIVGDAMASKPIGLVTAAGSSRGHLSCRDIETSLQYEYGCPIFPLPLQSSRHHASGDAFELRVRKYAVAFYDFARRLRGFAVDAWDYEDDDE